MEVPKHKMSSKDHIVCPECESGRLPAKLYSLGVPECDSCGQTFEPAIFKTLKQISTLQEALGKHACEECWHPEMRRLPDGVFLCPACCSEVLPANVVDNHLGEPSEKDIAHYLMTESQEVPVLRILYRWITRMGGSARVEPGVDLATRRGRHEI